MLALAVGVSGWVTISQARFGGQIGAIRGQFRGENDENTPHVQQKLGYLWSFPEDADDRTGLGGGITWQWDPELCDALIDKFDEDFFFIPFIKCSDLKASMHRAFASWSDNHKDINFVEVTEECKAIGQDHEGCELAEVFVTALAKPELKMETPPGPPAPPRSEDERASPPPPPSASPSPAPPSLSPPPGAPPPDVPSGAGGSDRRLQQGTYEAVNPTLNAEGGDSSAATASPKARISKTFRYTNGHRPHARTPDKAAFASYDGTDILNGAIRRVGKQVTILDGKIHYLGQVYQVTWVGEPPPTSEEPVTDYIATVDGEVGGNVTLVEGHMFLNPEGLQSLQVIETYGATISFNTELCWYLDSTFCSYFHSLKNVKGYSASMVLLVLQVILFSIFSLAATIIVFQLFHVVTRTACHKKSPGQSPKTACVNKLKRFMDEIAKWGIIGLTFRLICLWTPPIAYAYLFLPCWSCFDFEGAATHEVGHVLGLSHPDTASQEICTGAGYCNPEPGRNSYSTALNGKDADGNWRALRMNRSSCDLPWDDVRVFDPKMEADVANRLGAEMGDDVAAKNGWPIDAVTGMRDTIMEAFTQHNPSVCLTYDDLEALNVIYPQCEYAISEPVCYKTEYYIGWIRLGVWVGLPIIFMLVFICLLSASVRKHQFRRMRSLHNLNKEKSGHLKVARGEARRASCEAAQLAEALDMQIATEESRIQERAKRMSVQMVNEHLEQLRESGASIPGGALGGGSDAVRGTSFLRRLNSGKDRKWLGASMKKVGSALGLQKQNSLGRSGSLSSFFGATRQTDGPSNLAEGSAPSSLINVPEQYRLNSAEMTETIEQRLSKSQASRASSLGESSSELGPFGGVEINTTDRTRTMHKFGGGAARATVVDRGSMQSLEEIPDACDEAVQISMPS